MDNVEGKLIRGISLSVMLHNVLSLWFHNINDTLSTAVSKKKFTKYSYNDLKKKNDCGEWKGGNDNIALITRYERRASSVTG